MDEKATIQALETALSIRITSTYSYDQAVLFRENLKALKEEIDSAFDPQIKSANETHKAALAAKKKYMDPVSSADAVAKQAISAWERSETLRVAEEAAALAAIGAQQELIEVPPESTTYIRKSYSAVVTDKMALLRAVLSGEVDHNVVIADMSFLNGIAAKTHELFKVPGCTVEIKETVCTK